MPKICDRGGSRAGAGIRGWRTRRGSACSTSGPGRSAGRWIGCRDALLLLALGFHLLPAFQSSLDLLLEPPVARLVVPAAGERRRQTVHRGNRVWLLVGVPIVLPVVQVLHQLRRRVAEMERNRLGRFPMRISRRVAVRGVDRVALRRGG